MQKLLIATKNNAKLARFQRLLTDYKLDLVSLFDLGITKDVAETESTFKANALLKARTYHQLSNLAVLAEGPQNREASDKEAIQEVLKRIANVPKDDRNAYFVSELALAMPDGKVYFGHGEAWGKITDQTSPKIMSGFPYRSIFISDGDSKTIAELEDETIHADYLTQRKQAIIQLEPYLKQLENYV